MLLLHDKDQ